MVGWLLVFLRPSQRLKVCVEEKHRRGERPIYTHSAYVCVWMVLFRPAARLSAATTKTTPSDSDFFFFFFPQFVVNSKCEQLRGEQNVSIFKWRSTSSSDQHHGDDDDPPTVRFVASMNQQLKRQQLGTAAVGRIGDELAMRRVESIGCRPRRFVNRCRMS